MEFAKVGFCPQCFLTFIYNINGLGDILNNLVIGDSFGGIRVNHMLYADDLHVCIISLSSAGLQQLLVQCDDYCGKHSITFNVSKSICMFFKSAVNKKCDTTELFLSSKAIDFVQETKYLGVMLNSQLKTSVVLPMSNVCCLGHIAQICTVLLYGSTPHLVVSRNLKLVITVC